ncbi:MAG TPA: hypothetical protein PK165_03600 [bacterium]|nr:hypothetical protein [bacterium]HPO51899.1 hypothetical protein [bacterium]
MNFFSSAAVSIKVEIQKPDGTAYKEFSLKKCVDIFGDNIRRIVKWKVVQVYRVLLVNQ